MTETLIDITELVDFDSIVECNTSVEDCDKEAVWLFVKTCCNYRNVVCDEHRNKFLIRQAALDEKYERLRCRYCPTSSPTPVTTTLWHSL